jgi:DNA-binding LacI/PurR family transcriptional regulator/DNA-binding transcriptional regulator YhcF (GntR family)
MGELRFLSKIEQVAAHLRAELAGGRWEKEMPGRLELAAELGINAKTVEEALRQLELEGVLAGQGAGRRRLIAAVKEPVRTALKVRILLYERIDQVLPYNIEVSQRLRQQGHADTFAEKSLHDLRMDVKRVAAHVKAERADAWMVCSGSREILEWFAAQPTPAFAQFGRCHGLPLAGIRVDKIAAMKRAVRRLHGYGHRRIVLLSRRERVKPYPASFEQAFLDELNALGLATGDYNLPDWGDDIADFYRGLDSLFQHTPPTALFLMEARLYIAAQQHLSRRGIIAPRDVSLICDDPDVAFSWCLPVVSHFHWDTRPVVSRVVRWVENVARGKEDRRQTLVKAEFVEGGTIGPLARRDGR